MSFIIFLTLAHTIKVNGKTDFLMVSAGLFMMMAHFIKDVSIMELLNANRHFLYVKTEVFIAEI